MLLSGPISLICLKLAKSIFMPQACYFLALILFHRKSFPNSHGISEKRKEGEGKGFSYLPCLEKTQEPGKMPQKSVWAQQAAAANKTESQWEICRSVTGEQASTSVTSVQLSTNHVVTRTRAEAPPAITAGLVPPEQTFGSPSVKSFLPLPRML